MNDKEAFDKFTRFQRRLHDRLLASVPKLVAKHFGEVDEPDPTFAFYSKVVDGICDAFFGDVLNRAIGEGDVEAVSRLTDDQRLREQAERVRFMQRRIVFQTIHPTRDGRGVEWRDFRDWSRFVELRHRPFAFNESGEE